MAYRQLTQEQRYLIYKLREEGYLQVRIAEVAGVHPSTVSRELRRNVKRRGYRPKMAHRLGNGPIRNRRFIDERPASVESREELGHWELDSMVAGGGCGGIVTMVERTSDLVVMAKVERLRAREVRRRSSAGSRR